MAGEHVAAGTVAVKKLPKEEEEDDDELDNIPLALSKAKLAGNASASKVKEEEDDDEEDNLPISHSRAKKGNEKQKGTVKSNTKASKVKKQEVESDDDDFMPISQKKNAGAGASNAKASKVKKLKDEDLEDLKDKKRKKRVGVKEGAMVAVVKDEKAKKEKKVYDLPGQKHDPPPERDPLRIFYESLYDQVPTSDMAATWLMEWGLLPLDVARKVFEKKQGQKLKSPVKTTLSKRKLTSPTKTPASSAMKSVSAKNSAGKLTSQKKRKASSDSEEENDDDDFMAPKVKTKRQKASS